MVGTRLWPTVNHFRKYYAGIKKTIVRVSDFDQLLKNDLKRLVWLDSDKIILGLQMVLDFCKRTTRNEIPLFPGLVLAALTQNKIMLVAKLANGDIAHLVAEREPGQEQFKMDPRFLPALGLEDDNQVVADVSELAALTGAQKLQVFVLVQE